MERIHETQFREEKDIRINANDYISAIMTAARCKAQDICNALGRSKCYLNTFKKSGFMHRRDLKMLESIYGIPFGPFLSNVTSPRQIALEVDPAPVVSATPANNTIVTRSADFFDLICSIDAIATRLPKGVTITIQGGAD